MAVLSIRSDETGEVHSIEVPDEEAFLLMRITKLTENGDIWTPVNDHEKEMAKHLEDLGLITPETRSIQ